MAAALGSAVVGLHASDTGVSRRAIGEGTQAGRTEHHQQERHSKHGQPVWTVTARAADCACGARRGAVTGGAARRGEGGAVAVAGLERLRLVEFGVVWQGKARYVCVCGGGGGVFVVRRSCVHSGEGISEINLLKNSTCSLGLKMSFEHIFPRSFSCVYVLS